MDAKIFECDICNRLMWNCQTECHRRIFFCAENQNLYARKIYETIVKYQPSDPRFKVSYGKLKLKTRLTWLKDPLICHWCGQMHDEECLVGRKDFESFFFFYTLCLTAIPEYYPLLRAIAPRFDVYERLAQQEKEAGAIFPTKRMIADPEPHFTQLCKLFTQKATQVYHLHEVKVSEDLFWDGFVPLDWDGCMTKSQQTFFCLFDVNVGRFPVSIALNIIRMLYRDPRNVRVVYYNKHYYRRKGHVWVRGKKTFLAENLAIQVARFATDPSISFRQLDIDGGYSLMLCKALVQAISSDAFKELADWDKLKGVIYSKLKGRQCFELKYKQFLMDRARNNARIHQETAHLKEKQNRVSYLEKECAAVREHGTNFQIPRRSRLI